MEFYIKEDYQVECPYCDVDTLDRGSIFSEESEVLSENYDPNAEVIYQKMAESNSLGKSYPERTVLKCLFCNTVILDLDLAVETTFNIQNDPLTIRL